ncbi:unnamed protein product [Enterobius vermicularis]|uniref:Ion_trans domain-containing protein n=1 Tax=Enterobius vermicularis TaxID=51028 RepID=A0A158QA17_ENTVE|nr:unnamed protein product [Enterobius vermicularis]
MVQADQAKRTSKAAALSGAMLTHRKSSSTAQSQSQILTAAQAVKSPGSVALITEMLSLDTAIARQRNPPILQNVWVTRILRTACLLSMISVCFHTPYTISFFPPLHYILFIADSIVTFIFFLEALIKIATNGLLKDEFSYFRDRWCQFDFSLLISHIVSLCLDAFELVTIWFPQLGFRYYQWYSVFRSPRPFVMIRFIRCVLRFKLPKNRIQQIIKRSSQQIQNVTIFFMFFMAFYAIMGVQLFGRMNYHCVLKGTDPSNVTILDLAIPDTMCSGKGGGGYECPDNMECMKLDMTAHAEGFYGMFNDFSTSLFTVYLAASQEGWVYVLYDCLDTFPSYIAIFYFVTLIFFLAWLVKNVFIAVITETFAEIRVQVSEMWQTREAVTEKHFTQRLEKTSNGWKLVAIDAQKTSDKNTPKFLHNIFPLHLVLAQVSCFRKELLNLKLDRSLGRADAGGFPCYASKSVITEHDIQKVTNLKLFVFEENLRYSGLFEGECGTSLASRSTTFQVTEISRLFVLASKLVKSTVFQIGMVILIILNAGLNALIVYKHDETDAQRNLYIYYAEVVFTLFFFDLECVLKIVGLGWRGYIGRGLHKLELLLCIGSTLNIIQPFYSMNIFTYFQVCRIIRLITASPMLEDFVYKIFGPGRKLGGLIIFTMVLLIITSAASLQLFCYVPKLDKFRTFPQAFMTMFQIITQEGWTEVVVEILRATNDKMVPFVAIYFVGYHLFVTLIVLSLFVAVILDNLEMDEELKRVKQLKAREETTCMRTTLPWRLRVFEKFPTRPQMVELRKVSSEFPLPKVRESFTRQFADDDYKDEHLKLLFRSAAHLRTTRSEMRLRQIGQISSKLTVARIIEESNNSRALLSDSSRYLAQLGRPLTRSVREMRFSFSRLRNRNLNSTHKLKSVYEHLKENGDIRPADSAPKKDLKQGEIDIKAFQQKRQHAEITRNRIEEDMRENHPFFDRPLLIIGRDSKIRRLCQEIVYAKYSPEKIDAVTGKQIQRNYKQLHALVGLLTYLDWAMVLVTCFSCFSMLFEGPWPATGENLIFNNYYLQICEYLFVVSMTFELIVKIVAEGFIFTPNAVVKDVGGAMTMFIYVTSLIYLVWMPNHVEINSLAQLMMIFRAMRPLRIYTLVPHIRRVVVELCKGFKEILLVTILLVVLMFIFASFAVQIVGGKLAACNDPSVASRENCTGIFEQKIFVTRMEVFGKNDDVMHPKVWVPRVCGINDFSKEPMIFQYQGLAGKRFLEIRHVEQEPDILILTMHYLAVNTFFYNIFLNSVVLTCEIQKFVKENPRNFNFDHIGNAMLALFETLSYKGWNVIRDILWMRHGPWAVLFIHIYVFMGCMIGLTLFVGVVIANYTENRGTALLTVDQRRWHDLKARLKMAQPLHVPPKPAESSKLRRALYEIALSKWFKQAFATLAVVNSATLAFPWNVDEERNSFKTLLFLTGLSAIANILFTVEVLLKMIAFTFRGFWQSRRNRRKTTLKMLMLTVVMSMVRSLFIISAMFLLVLFYAYMGVVLFGMVKYGQAVSKHVNFRSGKEALVVLFRSVTGEDWNDIMHDCMVELFLMEL